MAYADPFSGAPMPGDSTYKNYFLNNTPEAGFWSYLSGRGLLGNSPQAKFGQGQYNKQYGSFLGQAADNPNEGFYDYLQRMQPNFADDYGNQSPEQRGDFTSRSLTPRGRFIKAY